MGKRPPKTWWRGFCLTRCIMWNLLDRLIPMTISTPLFRSAPSALAAVLVGVLAGGFLLGWGGVPTAAATAQDLADLAGLWELDPEESDDPAEVMQRAMAEGEDRRGARGGRGFGPPGGRGGMGRGGMGRGGTGRGGPGGGGVPRLNLPDLLEIEADAAELRLVLEERVQILYLDGEEHAREDGRGGRITSVAEFRGGIARVREERELPFGKLELFRTLQVSGDVLVVRTELKMPRRGDPLLLRSVYRRLDGTVRNQPAAHRESSARRPGGTAR